ncbi:KH domain-containing protein HEN4 isoform X1 [Citrus sinensis]|uniref:KH domain-containing protein HEN4 isoform X1 n=1 Tax=Citrus sinensis TaxID=2711 RepID=UPI000CED72D2|nr:KH domain-containing protein HEN4 isoform X1 [Citrus sinensis]XP_024034596.1 KH domain-containing protein HEN4 isoform X1 [Citrus x clementina]
MKRTIMSDPNPYGTANGSSNKRSKQPAPPLVIPHGHVAFRLLCHSSRIGGVIGKSGNVIKQLQQSTGARIRVEEPPTETPDRVVTVIAPPSIDTTICIQKKSSSSGVNSGANGNVVDGDNLSKIEVSKAQEALIRVFERILEVASETEGVEMGVVSCRLLAETKQVGSVIGKGGKVVEKIRKESGCKIRVLAENLSACAGPNDEIIELTVFCSEVSNEWVEWGQKIEAHTSQQIDGDVLAVKKALIAVSRCLQDCPPSGKTRMTGSRFNEANLQETIHKPLEVAFQESICRPVETILHETIRRPVDTIPHETIHRPLDTISHETIRRSLEAVPHDTIARPVEAVPQEILWRSLESGPQEILRRPLEVFAPESSHRSSEAFSIETQHRLFGAVSQEILPDLHVDILSQRNSVLTTAPSSSISYVSAVRPLSLESDRVATLDARTQQQEVSFRILCSNDKVGAVIGKGGTIIRALQSEAGAFISVGATMPECDERLITVTASEGPESRYSPAQKAVVLVFSRLIEGTSEKGLDFSSNKGLLVNARLVVASNQVGCLLGKGGTIISEMRKVTGTSIRIISDQLLKCISENDRVVQISGEFSKVKDAVYNVTGRLRDNHFSGTLNTARTRSTSSVLTETSPYSRLKDPASFGVHSSVAVSHDFSQPPLTQGMDHLGLSHSLDCPSSPKLWTAQTVTGVHLRGSSDVGRGWSQGLSHHKGGLELGSGSKSAIVTNTTVEIIVPENVIGSVYGENGSNLLRLRQISGAKVIVHEPRLGSTDRIVVISGTPDETQAAQSLLQAFILTGPS